MIKEKLSRIRAVIFDLDGTLIDSLSSYLYSMNTVIKKFGLDPITKERLRFYLNMSKPLQEILQDLSPLFLNPEMNRRVAEEILDVYLEVQKESVSLLPGVREVLEFLKRRGVKVGIVTGRTIEGEKKYLELERLGIRELIDCFVTARETERKPSSSGILKCLEELKANPEEAIFVGDSVSDMEAGKKARLFTVGVLTGVGSREDLLLGNPDCLIEDLRELLDLL